MFFNFYFFCSLFVCLLDLSFLHSVCEKVFHICINLQPIGVAKNQQPFFFLFSFFTFLPSPLRRSS